MWYVVNSCVWFGWPDCFVRCVVKRCVWFGWPGYFVYDCWDHIQQGKAIAMWEVMAHHVAVGIPEVTLCG